MNAGKHFPTLIDGVLHAPGAGTISVDDQGFLLGLAVFETMLYEDGCRYFAEQHLARLAQGAQALSIAGPSSAGIQNQLERYCRALGAHSCALRITLTRGVPGGAALLVIGARELTPPPAAGVAVVLATHRKLAQDALENVKSTNRARNFLAREAALKQDAFEALLCTEAGDVSEGTQSNVFACIDQRVITPSLARGALPGVMRGELISAAAECGLAIQEGRLEPRDLARASEVWLSNTTGRVIPVLEVRGVIDGLPGPRGAWAQKFSALIRARELAYRRSHSAPGA